MANIVVHEYINYEYEEPHTRKQAECTYYVLYEKDNYDKPFYICTNCQDAAIVMRDLVAESNDIANENTFSSFMYENVIPDYSFITI